MIPARTNWCNLSRIVEEVRTNVGINKRKKGGNGLRFSNITTFVPIYDLCAPKDSGQIDGEPARESEIRDTHSDSSPRRNARGAEVC